MEGCKDYNKCNITREFENLLMFLADNYPEAYEDWKSHLTFVNKKCDGK